MRYLPCFLMIMLFMGCESANESQQVDNNNEQQIGSDTKKQDVEATAEFTHVIATEAEYYTTGPQQSRPPDGKFSAGTRINIVEEAGSYTFVHSEGGVEAYVAADAVKQQETPAVDMSDIATNGNKFAFDLYRQLRTKNGNLFFSPSSISTALAMTYAGAAGATKSEMAKTLHFLTPDDQLHQEMRSLQANWETPNEKSGIRLQLANRLWGHVGYQFLPDFLRITREQYGAELARLDFNNSEKARQTINTWVKEQTENKINDLFPAGSIAQDAKLILTNAVYFHGLWRKPFGKNATTDEDFHLSDSETIKVPLMHQMDSFQYCEVEDVQLLELPYGDRTLSMFVLLPKKVDGLVDLEGKLTFENLDRWISKLSMGEVKVYLPKFKTNSQFELGDTLITMGMRTAFDAGTADFSGMTGGRDLFISAVMHKAFVDVNEEGTEAAAATGVVMAPTSAMPDPEPQVFRADHPFIFLIRDNRNGAILFLGRILNPLE